MNSWVVACHQKDLVTLEKLRDSCLRDDNSIECPLGPSTDNGNTALHFAALSDFTESFDILVNSLSNQQKCSRLDAAIKLLSLTNDHGDTPIMMLAVYNFVYTLDSWLNSVIQIAIDSFISWPCLQPLLAHTLSLTNDNSDTALSLAYGHGNYKIVESLIKERTFTIEPDSSISCHSSPNITSLRDSSIVIVSHSDIEHCQLVLGKVDAWIETLKQKEATEKYLSMIQEGLRKRDDIRRSLVVLQVANYKLAENTIELLLEQENNVAPKSVVPKKKSNKSLYPKKSNSKEQDKTEKNSKHSILEKPMVTTLMDGSVIVPRNMESNCSSVETLHISSEQDSTHQLMKDMLTNRCSDSLKKDGNRVDAVSIEDTLASLCLEPPMLLYTAHGMALHLSPSQLDALELLLTNQLEAVQHAKDIQNAHRSLLL